MDENLQQKIDFRNQFTKVTPFSKYLAMVLFIVMPFIGGWVGYVYTPEKIVETERVTYKEVQSINNSTEGYIFSDGVYQNPTLGIRFAVPALWTVESGTQDSATHGDVLKDGKIYSSFSVLIKSKEAQEGVQLAHTFLDADNTGLEEQQKKLSCEGVDRCQILRNRYNVEYMRVTEENAGLSVIVPTGKYILVLSPWADEENLQSSMQNFENVVNSMEIVN